MKPLAIKNSWVLVTGASTGLGRASALRLAASYQAKPLIVGRRLDNLRELQTEIDERFNVPCEIIVADQREIEGREKIAAKVAELQVTAALLVAGMTSVGSFDAGRADTYAEVIETNILGFTDLLARLIAIFREQPFESSVIAVSSLAGETSVPFQAVYGASKAYVSTLSVHHAHPHRELLKIAPSRCSPCQNADLMPKPELAQNSRATRPFRNRRNTAAAPCPHRPRTVQNRAINRANGFSPPTEG